MKKVYFILLSLVAFSAQAFAEAITVDPTAQYQMTASVNIANGDAGNIYAKAILTGNDAAYIDMGGTAANDGAYLIEIKSGDNAVEGQIQVPTGNLTKIDRIVFTLPWTAAGATVTIKDIKIINQSTKADLMEGVKLVSVECTHLIAAYESATPTLTEDGSGFSVLFGTRTDWNNGYSWEAQFALVIDKATSSAVEETEAVSVYSSNGRVYVDAEDYAIYNLIGQDVTADNGSLKGLYIVKAGNEMVKLMVD